MFFKLSHFPNRFFLLHHLQLVLIFLFFILILLGKFLFIHIILCVTYYTLTSKECEDYINPSLNKISKVKQNKKVKKS